MATAELPPLAPPESVPPASPRRADVEAKQERIARLLQDADCEGVLVLDPANFRWLTAGAGWDGLRSPEEWPALYFNPQQRWLVCPNTDTQRFFDEELDGLGFQLKEWPWHASREQLLADLCAGRRTACDKPFRDCVFAGTFFEQERRVLSAYEQEQLKELGRIVGHALEATGRNLARLDAEEEVAGHIGHRLLHHGAEPVFVQVAADGRNRRYRRHGTTPLPVRHVCTMQVTAKRAGLFVTAGRTVCFGTPEPDFRAEFDAASRLSAVYFAATKPGLRAAVGLDAGRRLLRDTPFEHEWRLAPPGYLTGRTPAEVLFVPDGPERFAPGKVAVWQALLGGAAVCDTFLVGEAGPVAITPVAEDWPVRRLTIQGVHYDRPDLLVRDG